MEVKDLRIELINLGSSLKSRDRDELLEFTRALEAFDRRPLDELCAILNQAARSAGEK